MLTDLGLLPAVLWQGLDTRVDAVRVPGSDDFPWLGGTITGTADVRRILGGVHPLAHLLLLAGYRIPEAVIAANGAWLLFDPDRVLVSQGDGTIAQHVGVAAPATCVAFRIEALPARLSVADDRPLAMPLTLNGAPLPEWIIISTPPTASEMAQTVKDSAEANASALLDQVASGWVGASQARTEGAAPVGLGGIMLGLWKRDNSFDESSKLLLLQTAADIIEVQFGQRTYPASPLLADVHAFLANEIALNPTSVRDVLLPVGPVQLSEVEADDARRDQLSMLESSGGLALGDCSLTTALVQLHSRGLINLFESIATTFVLSDWGWAVGRTSVDTPALDSQDLARVCAALEAAEPNPNTAFVVARLLSEYSMVFAEQGEERLLIRNAVISVIGRSPLSLRAGLDRTEGAVYYADQLRHLLMQESEHIPIEDEVTSAWETFRPLTEVGPAAEIAIAVAVRAFGTCGVPAVHEQVVTDTLAHFEPLLRADHQATGHHWTARPDDATGELPAGWDEFLLEQLVSCYSFADPAPAERDSTIEQLVYLIEPSPLEHLDDGVFNLRFQESFWTQAGAENASASLRAYAHTLRIISDYRDVMDDPVQCGRFNVPAINAFASTLVADQTVVDALDAARAFAAEQTTGFDATALVDEHLAWINRNEVMGLLLLYTSAELDASEQEFTRKVSLVAPTRAAEVAQIFLGIKIITHATDILAAFTDVEIEAQVDAVVDPWAGPDFSTFCKQSLKTIKAGASIRSEILKPAVDQYSQSVTAQVAAELELQRSIARIRISLPGNEHFSTRLARLSEVRELHQNSPAAYVDATSVPLRQAEALKLGGNVLVILITLFALKDLQAKGLDVWQLDDPTYFLERLSPLKDAASGGVEVVKVGAWALQRFAPNGVGPITDVAAFVTTVSAIAAWASILASLISAVSYTYSAYRSFQEGRWVSGVALSFAAGFSAVAGIAAYSLALGPAAWLGLIAAGIVMAEIIGSAAWDAYEVASQHHDTAAAHKLVYASVVTVTLPSAMTTVAPLVAADQPISRGTPLLTARNVTPVPFRPARHVWETGLLDPLLGAYDGINLVDGGLIDYTITDPPATSAVTSPLPGTVSFVILNYGGHSDQSPVMRINPRLEQWILPTADDLFSQVHVAHGQVVQKNEIIATTLAGIDMVSSEQGVVTSIVDLDHPGNYPDDFVGPQSFRAHIRVGATV